MIIFGGLGGMMFLEELRHGAHGTMTGFGYPEILVDIFTRFTSGDVDGATEVFYRYVPLIRFENQPRINLAIRKHIYHRRGAIASPARAGPVRASGCGDAGGSRRHPPADLGAETHGSRTEGKACARPRGEPRTWIRLRARARAGGLPAW